MNTNLPEGYPKEVIAWWDTLSDQERIMGALRAYEEVGGRTLWFGVAMRPWKWAREAYDLRDVAWREPPEEEP